LPAGLEAIDSAFQTSPQSASEIADAWQIGDRQIYADRVTAYAWHLNPGVYEMHYLVRSVTPGTYAWPGTQAFVRGAPEIYGRSSSGELTITQ
ncbi:MAG: alpha-2-macroglobulin family protein, partial [Vulcanimicrobiaceae bacterium]